MKTDLEALKAYFESKRDTWAETSSRHIWSVRALSAIAELQAARDVIKALYSMAKETGGMGKFKGDFEHWDRLHKSLRAYDEVVK
jgi:hypothetical protein